MICDSYGRKTLCPSDSSLHCFIPALTRPGSAVKDCGKVLRFRSCSHHRVAASISSQEVSKSRDYVKVLYIVDLLASGIISISFKKCFAWGKTIAEVVKCLYLQGLCHRENVKSPQISTLFISRRVKTCISNILRHNWALFNYYSY